jgi:hypothetical protein
MSAPQKAVMLAARDLEQQFGFGSSWDLATLQIAASRYRGGEKVTSATLNGLTTGCKLVRTGGSYALGESGRARLREGL